MSDPIRPLVPQRSNNSAGYVRDDFDDIVSRVQHFGNSIDEDQVIRIILSIIDPLKDRILQLERRLGVDK